jgi:hypothetical protein
MKTRICALIKKSEREEGFLPCPPSCDPPESCERPGIEANIGAVPVNNYTYMHIL